jgi:predicted Zn-dependent protease
MDTVNTSRRPRLRPAVWVTAAALVAVLALAAWIGRPWYQDWAELREAQRLAAKGDFASALPLLLRLHTRRPQNVAVVRALALGYYEARQLTETEKFLDRWCELRPRETEPYRRRLQFRMMQQQVARAIADAEHILELEPNGQESRGTLVQLLLTDGRFEQAETEGLRCFRENPKNVDMWFQLANVYHGLGQRPGGSIARAKAADLTEQVLRVAPDHLAALKLRARLHLEAGQADGAIRLLKERVIGMPSKDGTEGLFELSEALLRAGRDDEAKTVQHELQWRQALGLWSKYEHRDDNPGLQARVVEAMLTAGKTDDAVHFLADILERNPQAPPGTHELLARCYVKQGQPERAAEQRRLAARRAEGHNMLSQPARETR